MSLPLSSNLTRLVEKKIKSGKFPSENILVSTVVLRLREKSRLHPGFTEGLTAMAAKLDDSAIQNKGLLPSEGDIAEMCFVVLLEATNDQDKDLALIMAQTKAMTNAKQALRDIISKVGKDVAQWRRIVMRVEYNFGRK